jgi:hypothetical protein
MAAELASGSFKEIEKIKILFCIVVDPQFRIGFNEDLDPAF